MTGVETCASDLMITHIGGLDCVIDTTINLDKIPGGKKLVYTHISMPLTAIADFEKMEDPIFKTLDEIVKNNNGLWCLEAEKYLLEQAGQMGVNNEHK